MTIRRLDEVVRVTEEGVREVEGTIRGIGTGAGVGVETVAGGADETAEGGSHAFGLDAKEGRRHSVAIDLMMPCACTSAGYLPRVLSFCPRMACIGRRWPRENC
jgi:hypothetical protein